MDARKLYIGFKLPADHEETIRGYLENFKDLKAFEVLETVDPERLHVTLLFLGDKMPEAQALRITESARNFAPFDGFVGEPMSFGALVLILRVYGSGLLVLNRRLKEAAARELGKPYQSDYTKYVPHVTLAKNEARNRDASHDIRLGESSLVNSPMMPFTVDRIGLYHKAELLHEVRLVGTQELKDVSPY